MRSRVVAVAVVAAVFASAAVAVVTTTASAPKPASAAVPPIEVVRDGRWRSVPACRVRGIAERLRAFSTALSRGDADRATRPFAGEPRFQWYLMAANREGELRVPSDRQRIAPTIYVRSDLGPYFASRIQQHERLRIIAVRVNYFDRRRQRAGFELVAERYADDLEALGVNSGRAQGKGDLDCRSGRITILSLGMAYPRQTHGYCGWKPADTIPRKILACVAEPRRDR